MKNNHPELSEEESMNFSFDEHHFCDETAEFEVEHDRLQSTESPEGSENNPEVKPKEHKCDDCQKTFNKSTDLRKHEVILNKILNNT